MTLKDSHCEGISFRMKGAADWAVAEGRHEVSAEVSTPITSEMAPIAVPFPSSSNAINLESAANGRKVITAPEPAVVFHEACGMGIEIGTESKGMTVSVRGRAAGIEPPLKVTLKGPHCWMEENKMELNFARTACGPIAREAIRKNAATNMTTRRGNAELLMPERCGHAGDEREKAPAKEEEGRGIRKRSMPMSPRRARRETEDRAFCSTCNCAPSGRAYDQTDSLAICPSFSTVAITNRSQ